MSRLTDTTLNLIRGDTGKWTVILTDDETGDPLVLTGCSLRMAIWATEPAASVTSDTNAALVLSSPSSGIAITDPDEGEITITISAASSAGLSAEIYSYDLQLTNATSEQYTVARGVVWVGAQMTHAS